MSDEYLFCNYKECKAPISKFTWVTRCSHVFCEEHGNSFFLNKSSKIKCPVCNEAIVRESDIIKTNLCPHDMMLCCVRPEKVLDYVANATKLWSYQMKQKKKIDLELLGDKYEKITANTMSKLKSENNELKRFIKNIEQKIKTVNAELEYTKRKLWKYKLAYNNICMKNKKESNVEDNNLLFQRFTANSDEFEDVLRYGDISNFDCMSQNFS